jgi:flagellar biosynthesis GTPase FlhF
MKELLQSIFSSANERIKNPFISAFITSWIIFNWQPIFLMIFSSKNIEEKIKLISTDYNNIEHLLFYPLISTIFYVLILPYINLLFEIILEFSKSKRNNIQMNSQRLIISNKQILAIEEIKFEEAKTEYRERNSHNKMIEDLQKNFVDIENNLALEREKNSENLKEFNREIRQIQDNHQKDIKQYKNQISNLNIELSDMRNTIYNAEREFNNLTDEKISRGVLSEKNEGIVTLRNGREFLLRNENNRTNYIDRIDGRSYSDVEFNKKFNN